MSLTDLQAERDWWRARAEGCADEVSSLLSQLREARAERDELRAMRGKGQDAWGRLFKDYTDACAEVASLTAIRERLEHTLRWIVEADYDPADPVSTLATWLTARTSAEHALGILGAAPSPERYACPECGAERNGVEPCANCGNRDAAAPSPEPRCEFCTDLVADHTPDELASCDADLRAAAPSPEPPPEEQT